MERAVRIDVRWMRFAAWALVCVLIVGAAVGGGYWLVKTAPEASKEAPEEELATVEVVGVQVVTMELELTSQGEVRPDRRTAVSAEVAGRIIAVDEAFEAGEVFEGEALLLQIDRADYEVARANAEAALAEADLALEMEEVRRNQALRDWAKLGNGQEPSDLVKREPQLARARAGVVAAQAAVDKALRDLERTEIRAPYRCRIERTFVDLGAVVSPGTPLVDLVSLGPVEVRLPLSLEDYGYLQRNDDGRVTGEVTARGRIGGEERVWNGRLARSEEIVESATRSINVVAEFGRGDQEAPPIGMFVKTTIKGSPVAGVIAVPREALRGGSEVLVVTSKQPEAGGKARDVLAFRKVEVLRTEANFVLVRHSEGGDPNRTTGLQRGDRIVVKAPGTPVSGLPVRVEESEAEGADDKRDEPRAAARTPERQP